MNNQEEFWQGQFGDEYTVRNVNLVENNCQMFEKIFKFNDKDLSKYTIFRNSIKSIIEFGAGSGQNILALQKIFSDAEYTAVEINDNAIRKLQKIEGLRVIKESILNYVQSKTYDLVLTKGLLIHIHPDSIDFAYEEIYNASNKYILLCEYYSPSRIMIPYRGRDDKLWKFDFIKPLLDKGCELLDYGFVSKYDQYPQDDLTWVLMEKK